ncbi:MAG: hypothetical protein ACKOYC_09345 [Bacteroidota bacterium]
MRKNIAFNWIVLLLCICNISIAQGVYPADGVYFTFESFRAGKSELVKGDLFRDSKGVQPVASMKQWFTTSDLYYAKDSAGIASMIDIPVWGYVENGTVHVFLNGRFHKILLFGTISYFKESYPIVKGQMTPVVTDARTTSTYRLLDMHTGRIGTYEPGRLETLMRNDEELLNAFRALGSAKTKQRQMYSFIERYNKKHPIQAGSIGQ